MVWRLLLYFAAGFFLWQIARYALRWFIQSSAPQEVKSAQSRARHRVDAIEEAEYQEIESKPKTPTN